MSLANLIAGKKTKPISNSATAISAIPAIVEPIRANIPPKIATIATTAVADNILSEVIAEPTEPISVYCGAGDCHCSGMLPGRNYPADCVSHNCEYYINPA